MDRLTNKDYMDRWKSKAKFLTEQVKHLNAWEHGFVSSITGVLQKNEGLTFRQSSTLNGIYNKITEKLG